MSTLDPLELVRRLGRAPLGPLVDALRRIHEQGTPDTRRLWDLVAERERATAVPSLNADQAPTPSLPDYEAARRHFIRHSERLREQAILTEKLLDGLAKQLETSTPAVLQEELRIQCLPGQSSSARFIVVNCLPRAVDVQFRPGHVHGAPLDTPAAVRVAFDPETPRLEPGAERLVRITVHPRDGGDLPNPLEFGVDVLGAEQLLLKLWVRVELRPGDTE
jgi:hypothetical protein